MDTHGFIQIKNEKVIINNTFQIDGVKPIDKVGLENCWICGGWQEAEFVWEKESTIL